MFAKYLQAQVRLRQIQDDKLRLIKKHNIKMNKLSKLERVTHERIDFEFRNLTFLLNKSLETHERHDISLTDGPLHLHRRHSISNELESTFLQEDEPDTTD
jgi:hypothetical protein